MKKFSEWISGMKSPRVDYYNAETGLKRYIKNSFAGVVNEIQAKSWSDPRVKDRILFVLKNGKMIDNALKQLDKESEYDQY